MKNRSVVVKLFAISALFFVIFILVALSGQSAFFERFYVERKIDVISDSVGSFNRVYSTSEWSNSEIIKKSKIFQQYNDVEFGIVDKKFNLVNEEIYEIVIISDDDVITKIRLNNIIDQNSYIYPEIKYGDEILATGYKWDEPFENFTPLSIDIKGNHWIGNEANVYFLPENVVQIEGTVIGFKLPTEEDMIKGIDSQNLVSVINYWMLENDYKFNLKKDANFIYKNPANGDENIVFVTFIDGKDQLAFVVASWQPVLESVEVIKNYYIYVLIAAIFVSFIMSYVFSITISKPLIMINQKAKKMANLDFSDYIEIKSNDEIGSLSKSLNTLSSNLQRSLDDLRTANQKLQMDIERERQVELMRKEFISGVSHELKTPLGIIKGFAEGIKDGIAKNKTAFYIDVILDEVDKMNSLVLDMLDLSRLQLASYKLVIVDFDMLPIIYEIKSRFTNKLIEKKLVIEINTDYDELFIEGDKRRIEQVISNFISNAIRHSYKNQTINIYLKKENDIVTFSIKNIGDKIPSEKLSKIWNRFYRVEESRTKEDGGTGLGLAIAKNILDLHGSDFGVRNIENGVEFFFNIKAVK